jgi:membrane-bound ClpP family serine protease
MNIFLDPNVAYFLLVIGLVLAVMALFAPGTGFFELLAVTALIAAGYGVINLPINGWALGLLLLGVFPFILALRRSRQYIFLVISLAALIVGSVFLFRGGAGQIVVVSPYLAAPMSILAALLLWFAGRKGIEAMERPIVHNPDRLIGNVGEARTNIYREGTLYVSGEEWTARSDREILAGSLARVISRDGLVLYVEPVQQATNMDFH